MIDGKIINNNRMKYSQTPYTDAGGNDLTHLDNVPYETCRVNCDNNVACKGFNFSANPAVTGNGTCWLKGNVVNKGNSSDWHLFTKMY